MVRCGIQLLCINSVIVPGQSRIYVFISTVSISIVPISTYLYFDYGIYQHQFHSGRVYPGSWTEGMEKYSHFQVEVQFAVTIQSRGKLIQALSIQARSIQTSRISVTLNWSYESASSVSQNFNQYVDGRSKFDFTYPIFTMLITYIVWNKSKHQQTQLASNKNIIETPTTQLRRTLYIVSSPAYKVKKNKTGYIPVSRLLQGLVFKSGVFFLWL